MPKGVYIRTKPHPKGFLGKCHTKKSRRMMSQSRYGRKPTYGMLGKKHSIETRRKISESQNGEKHPNWKGGINPLNMTIRKSFEYKLWRESVFKRDNYTCVWCGQIGGNLNADHIKPFAYYPELRFAIDNGRTLCRNCHKKTKTYGSKRNNSV